MALDHWRLFAACTDTDTSVFFPGRGYSTNPASKHDQSGDDEDENTAAGIAVCRTCPVELVCLHHGMAEQDGIWGGVKGETRVIIRRLGHDCPTCGTSIPTHREIMFCGDDCMLEAVYSHGQARVELFERLDALEDRAVMWNRLRKPGAVAAGPEQAVA